jgi:hypothetical protein
MKHSAYRVLQLGAAIVVGGGALFLSDSIVLNKSTSLVSSAHAIIGRPLTPLSYAGVARRTTRRAVVAGAAVGAVAAAPVVVAPAPVVVAPAPACVQAVDAYGRIYLRCR